MKLSTNKNDYENNQNSESISYFNSNITHITRKQKFLETAIKRVLNNVARKTYNYSIITDENASPDLTTNPLVLKEIAYILATSIKEFLVYSERYPNAIVSNITAYNVLDRIIRINLNEIRSNEIKKNEFYKTLEKKLSTLYKDYDVISKNPITQFMYWATKNIPRLCIVTKNNKLPYTIDTILKDYFENMNISIKLYEKNSINMTSAEVRNFLSSSFIDKILESKYYKKNF